MNNPRVFMDVNVGDTKRKIHSNLVGRMIFELFVDEVPKTVENFRSICTGERGLSYKNTEFHRIIKVE
jgi:cyclophilin family peptidyl-prolyl cis-trans isomerase